MTSVSALLADIEAAARALSTVAPDLGAKATKGKSYEVWLMFEIARELSAQGIPVNAVGHDGSPVPKLRVRGSPGVMPAGDSSTGNEPGHLVLGRAARHELHLGLQHAGADGSKHEIDLALLDGGAARRLRRHGGAYPGAPLLAVELKAHQATHKLDQGIPRALIGVLAHLDPSWIVEFVMVANRACQWSRAYRAVRPRCSVLLVTTTAVFDNSARMLEGYGVHVGEGVGPGSSITTVRALVDECRCWTG